MIVTMHINGSRRLGKGLIELSKILNPNDIYRKESQIYEVKLNSLIETKEKEIFLKFKLTSTYIQEN